jgi:glycerol kinase
MTVLAIDQGTSSTKAAVVGDDGVVIALADVPVTVVARTDGSVEVDPEELWASVVAAGADALRLAGSPHIDAIGLANQGETVVAWDRGTGAPAGPAIVWQDRRSSIICDRVADDAPLLAELTGLALDPYFVAPKLIWLRESMGSTADRLTFTTSDTWLLHRLCGAFVTDVATAGRSLLLDLDSGRWSPQAASVFGLEIDDLPSVVGNATPLGETTAFGSAMPVTGACVDQQAALFAEACHAAGEAKCTYGTGAFLLASTGSSPARSRNGLVACPAWMLGDALTWCLDGQVYTVGAAVNWLIDMGIIGHGADLDAVGGAVPDAGGVTFVPALAGLAAPYWEPSAKAAFTGLSLGTTRSHLVRAAIDGIAAQVALLAAAAGRDLGSPLTRLRVDGGLTRSRTLLQVQADLLQAPVEVYPSAHATVLGVAKFAAIGAGLASAGTTGAWTPSAVVEPSIGVDEAATRLHRWQVVADATRRL